VGLSVVKRNVTIVDTLWSLLFLLAAWRYATATPLTGPAREIAAGHGGALERTARFVSRVAQFRSRRGCTVRCDSQAQ
jgi:hypothetical protein